MLERAAEGHENGTGKAYSKGGSTEVTLTKRERRGGGWAVRETLGKKAKLRIGRVKTSRCLQVVGASWQIAA